MVRFRGTAARGFVGVMTDSEHRALEIHEITFDARDPHALAECWAALLEREIRPGDMPQDDSVLDDRRRADGTGWVVFSDPEGNEFCIGRSAAERAAAPQ